MATAQAVELKPPVRRFVFTEENTIADLFNVVNELELAGKPPYLKFLGTRGRIIAAEILIHDSESHGEMAVVGEDEQPDPAPADGPVEPADRRWSRVQAETPVFWEGEWTTWGALSGNERMECVFNGDGIIVGSYPI